MLAGLSALANLVFIAAYPMWSVIIIAVDVAVIYALATDRRGQQAPDRDDSTRHRAAPRPGVDGQRGLVAARPVWCHRAGSGVGGRGSGRARTSVCITVAPGKRRHESLSRSSGS